MIKRILGELILFIGLTSAHAQSELSAIRGPSVEEACKESASVIPTCLFSRKPANTPVEMITNDLGVCGCMKKSNFLFEATQQTPTAKDEQEKEKQRLIQNLDSVAGNSSVLQASSSSKSKRDQDVSLLVYGGQETRANLKEKDKKGPNISTNLSQVNTISSENAEWQCVTYQEYSLQREMPSDNDFFALLTQTEFKPDDWNVEKLALNYDSALEKDKNTIRLKMSFLSRNPIFQTIMKAKGTEKIPAAKVLAKQTELYNILRNLAPAANSTCTQVPNKCFQELLSSGKYQQYTDGVSRFLMDFDVIDIASAQAASDYAKELKRITDSGEQSSVGSVPTDPEGYFNYLQTANQQLLRECSGQQVKPECYTKFSGHCSHIEAIDRRVREGIKLQGGEISNILREEESVHATLDPNKNASFKAFNEKICLDPYSNSSGEKLNFFQYQAKYCSGAQRIPECSDRKKLLTKFLNDYSQGEVEADRNLRTAFGKIIGDRKFQDISEAQIIAANNISESPAELRARFGGSFPSISPAGKLVPAVPQKSTLAQTSSSSIIPDYSDIYSDSSSSPSNTPSRSSRSSFDDSPSSFSNGRSASPIASNLAAPVLPTIVPKKERSIPKGPQTRRLPASSGSEEEVSDSSDSSAPERSRPAPQTEQSSVSNPSSGGGGGGGSSNPSQSSSGSGISTGGSAAPEITFVDLTKPSRSREPAGANFLFKYGLDENNQPEVNLMDPTNRDEVKVTVDPRLLNIIRSNPNAFEMSKNDMDLVMANPDDEVKLVIGSKDGKEEIIVYAKKDATGGVSFALSPSKPGAKPKNDVMRISVLPEVHDSIIKNPDVYLNQNPTVVEQLMTKDPKTKKLLLQVVSPGKRALTYEIQKKNEFIYAFKRVGP